MAVLKDVRAGVKQNKTVYTLVVVGIIILIVVIIYNVYKSIKVAANVTGQAIGNQTIAIQTGIPVARVIYIRSEANRLWRDGVKSYYLIPGKYYNEAMFIKVINDMVSNKEVMLLDQLYTEQGGERLIDSINASFDTTEKKRLNQQWLAVLES